MTVEEMIDKVRDQYIEQIYALKAEAENNWKELEVYKKALELMAEQYAFQECGMVEQVIEHYLQIAREQE